MDHPTTTSLSSSLENNITLTTFSLVILSCTLISFIGVLPILIFKKFGKVDENTLKNSLLLRCLLNFSVGTLLFDAFCHIIPEAITISKDPRKILFRTIIGIIMFFGIEKFAKLAEYEESEEEGGEEQTSEEHITFCENEVFRIPDTPKKLSGNFASRNFSFKEPLSDSNNNMINSDNSMVVRQRHHVRSKNLSDSSSNTNSTNSEIITNSANNSISSDSTSSAVSSNITNNQPSIDKHKKTAAKLNLLANIMDNFYHGLSVGTAFLISTKCGFLAAFSILQQDMKIKDQARSKRANFVCLSYLLFYSTKFHMNLEILRFN